MKWLKRIVILFVLLVIAAAGALYLALDGIVKAVVEKQGTEQLNVPTTLSGVTLGLFNGTVDLNTFAIGSPQGFTAPQMFSVGKLAVDTGGVSHLRDQPIHISTITIDQPKLVIEERGGKVNFREMLNNMPKSTEPAGKSEPASGQSNPVKVVIDTLNISNAMVTVESDIPGLTKPYDVQLPAMTMKNIGNADGANNGAAIKDVATAVINKMVDQTALSGKLPIDVTKLLSGDFSSVPGQVGDAAQKELDKRKIPVNVGGILDQMTGKKP